ncbi:hypothetical protein EVAR_89979_1 [Eumeta japonica]|uniref:Uncharacterized protein n=1 Tax=Eumeta variegata TaxID=151549 RepID=A0A4C2AAZ5_EUMVA|nr:hypothetical protein EVAR_89979_1 [Eumeta japonica]
MVLFAFRTISPFYRIPWNSNAQAEKKTLPGPLGGVFRPLGHPVELCALEARERLSKRFRCWDRLTREQLLFTRNPSPRQSSRASLEYLLLPPRSAPTEVGGLTPRPFCALRRARPTRYGLMTARFKRELLHTLADSDFHGHRPAVLSDQRLSWCPMSVLGALTLRSVHPTAPVLLTKIGPLGTVIRSRGFIVRFRRSICTSESLRSSIRVSPDFDLTRHSSPSFGSQHLCSERALIRGLGTGRPGVRRGPRSASIPERSKKLKRLFTLVTPFSLIVTRGDSTTPHMLDSLVRVSRRVLRCPKPNHRRRIRARSDYTAAVSMQARSVEVRTPEPRTRRRLASGLTRLSACAFRIHTVRLKAGRPPSRSDDRVKVAGPERRSDRPRTGRDALLREKYAVPGDDTHDPRPPTRPQTEIDGRPGRPYARSTETNVESLRCTLKQPDSEESPPPPRPVSTGLAPSTGKRPRSRRTWTGDPTTRKRNLPNTTCRATVTIARFGAGLFPVRSPLLRKSLVSFPPLTNMLKFGG